MARYIRLTYAEMRLIAEGLELLMPSVTSENDRTKALNLVSSLRERQRQHNTKRSAQRRSANHEKSIDSALHELEQLYNEVQGARYE